MKTRIMVTDSAPLTPAVWGGPHRIFNLYSNLSPDFDVTYVGLSLDSGLKKIKVNLVKDNFREIVVPVSRLFPLVRGLQTRILKEDSLDIYSYLFLGLDSNFRRTVEREAKKADILLASHVWTFPLIKKFRNKKLVYDSHNCELSLMQQILGKGRLQGLIVKKVYHIEKEACEKSDLVIACSPADRELFIRHYKTDTKKIAVLPNAATVIEMPSQEEKMGAKEKLGIDKPLLFFVGAYYKPNIEAFEFIMKIADKMPGCIFGIAGSVCMYPDLHNVKVPENMRLFGVVSPEKLRELMVASDIGLNPIFTGSGVQIKLLDYMGHGLPVLTTVHGARGIAFENGLLFIAEPEEFKTVIRAILSDKAIAREVALRAHSFVQYFSGQRLGRQLEFLLRRVRGYKMRSYP